MSDDPGVIDNGWDALPGYTDKPGDGDDAVTISISTTPGEWLVNTTDAVVVPMSMMEVVEALRAQKLTERSLVWRVGMQEWAPVEKVPQLRLAARLPSVLAPSGPSPMLVTPLPKPSRLGSSPTAAVTRTPLPPPPSIVPRAASTSASSSALPSRKATLPFGVSKPLQSRPTPRPALPPPPSPDDSEVLAVYDRPAATISFDLAPEVAPRAPSSLLPQTLAPTTTDSATRQAPVTAPPPPASSVVPAHDFRRAQRFSKRLVVASSVGSALVASLLTLWLSRPPAPRPAAAPAAAPATTLTQAAPLVAAPPPSVAEPELAPAAEAALPEPSAKPKAKRKARVWRPAPKVAPAETSPDAPAVTEPKAESNPYDVQLEDDAPKPPAPSQPPGLDLERIIREEATGSGSSAR